MKVWLHFLTHYNGITYYREEMLLSTENQHIFTDASKSMGCGGVYKTKWFSISWPTQWWRQQEITLLELVPIVLALQAWAPFFKNKCVTLNTDNLALVHIINTQSSKDEKIMFLIRQLVFHALQENFLIKAIHIPGKKNNLSDALSRLQINKFRFLHPDADRGQWTVPPLPASIP